jgi:hypothetical protein
MDERDEEGGGCVLCSGLMKREGAQHLIASPRSLSEKPLMTPLLQGASGGQTLRHSTRACEWGHGGGQEGQRRGVRWRRMRGMNRRSSGTDRPRRMREGGRFSEVNLSRSGSFSRICHRNSFRTCLKDCGIRAHRRQPTISPCKCGAVQTLPRQQTHIQCLRRAELGHGSRDLVDVDSGCSLGLLSAGFSRPSIRFQGWINTPSKVHHLRLRPWWSSV